MGFTQSERDAIGVQLTKAAVFYDRGDLDKSRISIMISVLEEEFGQSGSEKILQAIREYRKDPKNKTFPAPSLLQPYLRPVASDESLAIESVNRIVLAIQRVGYTQPEQAKAFIGELGWRVVRDYGGWENLCRNLGVEWTEQTFRAQARESLKAKINLDKAGVLGDPIGLPSSEKNLIESSTKALPEPTRAGAVVKDILSRIDKKHEQEPS